MPREGVGKEQRSFTDEEMGKILSAAPEPFGTILAVTAVLGLRIGEVLALRKVVAENCCGARTYLVTVVRLPTTRRPRRVHIGWIPRGPREPLMAA
jgi:hypothetical protein